jgi:hypothetical protein
MLYQLFFDHGIELITPSGACAGLCPYFIRCFDFKVTRWITWLACISMSALAAIFLLQGVSLLIQNDALTYLVFQVLGQRLEAWLVDLLIVWFVALLFMDSQGKTRFLGFVAVSIVISVEV